MRPDYQIIPGILEKDWSAIEEKIKKVPFATAIHIDIIDGIFSPNKTFLDPAPFKQYANRVFFELHMMVDNPLNYIEPFAKSGFKRFLGHIEKMPDQTEFIRRAKQFGQAGLAIDAATPLSALHVPYEDFDQLVVMTIHAGFSGQLFLPELLEKARTARTKTQIAIEVDGGINDETILEAKQSGATVFAANSFLFQSPDPGKRFAVLKQKLTV